MTEIYLLLADGDGTMRSINTPFGVAVSSLEEAQRFVLEGGVGYTHSFQKLTVFDNKDIAIEYVYPKHTRED